MLRQYLSTRDQSSPRLVLCPFAGASGSAFSTWRSVDDFDLAMLLAIYPGRDHRMNQPPFKDVSLMAAEVADAIATMQDAERGLVVLAGHSMGAQVAFETCLRLEERGIAPHSLVLSACHAPHLSSRRRLAHLEDRCFVTELISIGGCNEEIRKNPEILNPFLPLLRADFLATETYHRELLPTRTRLKTPTSLLYGTQDLEASRDEVASWAEWLELKPAIHAVQGNHFYISDRPRLFAGKVIEFFHKQQVV